MQSSGPGGEARLVIGSGVEGASRGASQGAVMHQSRVASVAAALRLSTCTNHYPLCAASIMTVILAINMHGYAPVMPSLRHAGRPGPLASCWRLRPLAPPVHVIMVYSRYGQGKQKGNGQL